MPLISGLRKLICTLNDVPARTISCMSEETEVLVADGVPRPRLVLVGLGLVAVDPLHVGAGPTEVTTVVAEVDRRVDTARDDRTLVDAMKFSRVRLPLASFSSDHSDCDSPQSAHSMSSYLLL